MSAPSRGWRPPRSGQRLPRLPTRGGIARPSAAEGTAGVRLGGAALAFSPAGKVLATNGADAVVPLWEVPGLKLLATMPGQQGYIHFLTFDREGKRLAVTS